MVPAGSCHTDFQRHCLIDQEKTTVPTDLTPEASKWDNKCPHDDDDEITEALDKDEPAEPPKKKKKKKKNKDP